MSVFVCVSIRTSKEVLKPWFARSVVDGQKTLVDLFTEFATGEFDDAAPLSEDYQTAEIKINVGGNKSKLDVSVHPNEHVADIVSCIGNYIEYVVNKMPINIPSERAETERQAVNPFAIMMAVQRSRNNLPCQYPVLKPNAKLDLKNDILKWLGRNELGWSRDACDDQGRNFVDTLANVLWELDRHHATLNDRGCGLPAMLQSFQNYRQPETAKHRKRESCNLDYQCVRECSQSLFHLTNCSYMKSQAWRGVYNSILRLAENLRKYTVYLDNQGVASQSTHAKKVLRTDVDNWEIYKALPFINPSKQARYGKLHSTLLHAKPYEPVFMNDYAPTDRRRRNEYINEVVFPCNTVRYSYTGLHTHLHFVWRIDKNHNESQVQQRNDQTKCGLKDQFPVFHTRAMRKEFVQHFGRVTSVKSGILREAYRRLTADSSAATNLSQSEVDDRMRKVLDYEDADLVWDLRITNSGRTEEYQIFLQKCQEMVQGKIETAVNDRRHDDVDESGESVVHLAMAMSAQDLHEQVKKECQEGTPIPSVQWLRLQFWPTRCSAVARKNTGRIKVKMMVAARQFRKHHIDAHYASAVFRYEKEFCVRFREHATLICEDDKHTIKVGEPGFPVAAVERGKRVIVGFHETLQVGDHDFTKFSLSPSVSLNVDIPETIDGSFYHGQVHVGLKENAFEASTALRHAAELKMALNTDDSHKPIECHYHDGGPDHNLRFVRTQLGQIAYFLERDLDLLLLVQTPPHHSWKNPAERVMSNLNLGLQGVGVMRAQTRTREGQLKAAHNLKGVRDLEAKQPGLKEEVFQAIQPCKDLLNNIFCRLHLKGKSFRSFSAANIEEMRQMADKLKKIDSQFNTTLLLDSARPCPKPSGPLKDFMDRHCRSGQYLFSIKRCGDEECPCGKPKVPPQVFAELHHLPFPVPGKDHYKSFEELYGTDVGATEKHLPSRIEKAANRHSMPFSPSAQKAQNVRTVVQCEECLKWRVCYTANVLKGERKHQLERELERLSYSCGSCFQEIDDRGEGNIFDIVFVNDKLTCQSTIELPYYAVHDDPLCFYCGSEINLKTSPDCLPLCAGCERSGMTPKRKITRAFTQKDA